MEILTDDERKELSETNLIRTSKSEDFDKQMSNLKLEILHALEPFIDGVRDCDSWDDLFIMCNNLAKLGNGVQQAILKQKEEWKRRGLIT